MDDRDRLAFYPFVVVCIACRVCSRTGSYRLARLAAKYGPEITLRDLTERFSYDCLWRAEARSKKGKSACGVYLPDLEHKRNFTIPGGKSGGREQSLLRHIDRQYCGAGAFDLGHDDARACGPRFRMTGPKHCTLSNRW
jgi:hypothetical protein